MKRKFPIAGAILAVAAAGALALPTSGGAANTTIKVGDDFFSPASKTVKKGTKIKFKWIGDRPHNVVKQKGPGGGFASRTTSARGVNFSKKFKKAGTYKIICTIHGGMQMTLKVKK